MRPGMAAAHRAAHDRRAFLDDVKSVWDDMFGKDDDEDEKPGPGKGNGPPEGPPGPGRKTAAPEEEEPTQIIVTRTRQETITAPAITRTQKGPEPHSTLLVADTTTQAKGTPLKGSQLPTAVVPTMKSDQPLGSSLAIAPPETTTPPATTVDRADIAGLASASSKPTAAASTTDETSAGTKAGIAIGVLAGLLALFVLVWFIFSKRKKQIEKQRLEDDEKINGPFSDNAAIRSPATAPRLSLRPVTQFIPNLMPNGEKRASQAAGAMLGPSSAAVAAQASPLNRPAGASAWERPTTASLHNASPWDRATASPSPSGNPFNDSQRMVEDPNQPRPVSPLDKATAGPPQPVSPIENALPAFPTPTVAEAAAAGAAVGVAAGAGLVRKASMRKDLPKPLDLTRPPPLGAVPPSPAGTEYSMNFSGPGQSPATPGAAAIAAAGGPAQSTVHRVQLDFKPTLEDELELKAGDLVRLLHEYDDGWALCIRLDRSRQGVVPRTCLSVRPVKPRPPPNGGPRGGPPVNPQRGPPGYRGPPPNGNGQQYPRPGSANSQYGRPGSAAGGQYAAPRPGSANGQYGGPRPGSAAGGGMRSQSPGPRSQSPAGMNRRMSPPGPSAMNPNPNQQYNRGPPQGPPPNGPIERRPVPGQAY
ncbi:variant SH3 domain containing protein [Rhypophila decipiens]